MEIKINNKRTIVELIVIAVLLFWAVNHFEVVRSVFRYGMGILAPVIAGCGIAFVLNVPMRAIERLLGKNRKIPGKFVRVMAVVLTLLAAALVLTFVFAAIIPEMVRMVSVLNKGIPKLFDKTNVLWQELMEQYPAITTYFSDIEFNWSKVVESVVEFLRNGVSNIVASTWGVATSVIGAVSSVVIGFIIALYILLRKETLCRQTKKVLYAYLPEEVVKNMLRIAKLANRTFSGFISSQCMEAVIFGCLTYVAMLIFRFPYASSVSVFMGFTALIPVVGAFVGTGLGALLILVENPIRAVWFVIMIMILQQFDNNLIYPRVVGTSVGLPGMWVLIAVTLGGSLMGVAGMLIFVPLVSVLYQLFSENINAQLKKKKITEEKIRETVQ